MHGFELGGKHTPTLPPCLLEFEWLSGPLIHNSFITFLFLLFDKTIEMSQIEKLHN